MFVQMGLKWREREKDPSIPHRIGHGTLDRGLEKNSRFLWMGHEMEPEKKCQKIGSCHEYSHFFWFS